MVATLAQATSITARDVIKTFIPCSSFHLLPRPARTIGCAQCWLDWQRRGIPLYIERSWILRIATYCNRHQLLLTDLAAVAAIAEPVAAEIKLREIVDHTRAEMDRFDLVKGRLSTNARICDARLSNKRAVFAKRLEPFVVTLTNNRFHLTPIRHLLLASLHSKDPREAERLDQLFQFSGRPLGSGRPLDSTRKRPNRFPPPKLSPILAAMRAVLRRAVDRDYSRLRKASRSLVISKRMIDHRSFQKRQAKRHEEQKIWMEQEGYL